MPPSCSTPTRPATSCATPRGERAQLLGDVPAVRACAEAVLALAAEHDMPMWRGYGLVFRGWALAAEGRPEDGASLVRQGIAELGRARHACSTAPTILGLLAEIHARLGDPAAGLRVLEEAYEEVARTEVRLFEAELRRLEGELRLLAGEPEAERGGVLCRGARRGTSAGGQVVRAARRDRPRPPVAGRGSVPRRTTSSPRSTAGSPKGSTRGTCGMRRRCSTSSDECRPDAFGHASQTSPTR